MTTMTLTEKMINWQLRKVKEDPNVIGRGRYLFEKIVELTGWGQHSCTARNRYFAETYKVHIDTISRWLTSLEKAGYIQRETIRDPKTKEIIKRDIYLVKPKDMTREYIDGCEPKQSLKVSTPVGTSANVRESIKQETNIKQEEETNEIFSAFELVNQTISDKEKYVLSIFEKEFGKEFVLYAINKSSHADNKIAYIRTLLNDWKSKGIKSTSELEPKFNILDKIKKANKGIKGTKGARRSKAHKHTLVDGTVVEMKNQAKRVELVPDWLKASNDSWNKVHEQEQQKQPSTQQPSQPTTTTATQTTSTDSKTSETAQTLSETSIRSMISSHINFNMPILEKYKTVIDQYIQANPSVVIELKL